MARAVHCIDKRESTRGSGGRRNRWRSGRVHFRFRHDGCVFVLVHWTPFPCRRCWRMFSWGCWWRRRGRGDRYVPPALQSLLCLMTCVCAITNCSVLSRAPQVTCMRTITWTSHSRRFIKVPQTGERAWERLVVLLLQAVWPMLPGRLQAQLPLALKKSSNSAQSLLAWCEGPVLSAAPVPPHPRGVTLKKCKNG